MEYWLTINGIWMESHFSGIWWNIPQVYHLVDVWNIHDHLLRYVGSEFNVGVQGLRMWTRMWTRYHPLVMGVPQQFAGCFFFGENPIVRNGWLGAGPHWKKPPYEIQKAAPRHESRKLQFMAVSGANGRSIHGVRGNKDYDVGAWLVQKSME